MAILVTCGACGVRFRARDEVAGREFPCPGCRRTMAIAGEHVSDRDVFISHSNKDKLAADALCAALEARRVRCWIAPRDIPAGATWGAAIIDAIEDARVMVLIYSTHANHSQQVLREVERAVAKGLMIAPLRLDAHPMSKEMEYFLSASHWFDAMNGPLEQHLAHFVPMVRSLLAPKRLPSEKPASTETHPKTGAAVTAALAPLIGNESGLIPTHRNRWMVGMAMVLAVGAALLIWSPWRSDSPGTDTNETKRSPMADLQSTPATTSPKLPTLFDRRVSDIEILDTPFIDVMEFLSDAAGTPVLVAWADLELANVTRETRTSLRLTNVTCRAAFDAALKVVGSVEPLTWSVGEGGIVYVYVSPAKTPPTRSRLVPGPAAKALEIQVDILIPVETELVDLLSVLTHTTGLNIAVAWNELEPMGVTRNSLVSMKSLREVPAIAALDAILWSVASDAPLTWLIDESGEVVHIAPKPAVP